MKHAAALFLLCCLLLPSLAPAAEAEQATPMELFKVMEMDSLLEEQMEALLPVIMNIVKAETDELPPVAVDIVFEEAKVWMQEVTPKIIAGAARMYADHFTPEEIAELVAVHKIPVMQKLRRELPVLMQEMMSVVNAIVEQEMGRYLERIETRLHEEFPEKFPKEQ